MRMFDEASRSASVLEYLNFASRQLRARGRDLEVHAKQAVLRHLMQWYGNRGFDDELTKLASEAVIVVPRHREGFACVVSERVLTEQGDTEDGEYERVTVAASSGT